MYRIFTAHSRCQSHTLPQLNHASVTVATDQSACCGWGCGWGATVFSACASRHTIEVVNTGDCMVCGWLPGVTGEGRGALGEGAHVCYVCIKPPPSREGRYQHYRGREDSRCASLSILLSNLSSSAVATYSIKWDWVLDKTQNYTKYSTLGRLEPMLLITLG